MRCPYCLHDDSKVVDKREAEDKYITRRRRECLKCQKRFTTYERVETIELYVIKKDGVRQQFDREKLKKGLLKATEKRNISIEKIDAIVEKVIAKILTRDANEVKSDMIGQLVMKELAKIDKVAYIRFASVYRDFTDLESFESELKKILKKRGKS